MGGGGIPLVAIEDGRSIGIEAGIDMDQVSGLLADQLKVDVRWLLVDVDAVYTDSRKPNARAVAHVRSDMLKPADFTSGSIRPKIGVAKRFAGRIGRTASIGEIEDAMAILRGEAGTTAFHGSGRRFFW
jgi:carbamate kinase